MKIGLYAGSFDPWSEGHQFVLERTLEIFDAVHIVVAVNPSKQSRLDAETRARLVAHAIDPFCNWWECEFPLKIRNQITISAHDGLVADYAQIHNIRHLIRGLRSTTDFESEFNLYFANQAIEPSLQTWAIMCPPKLLHCSSTYIRAVVGNPRIKFIGTSFAAQALMLNQPRIIGHLFDLISATAQSTSENFKQNLQISFSEFVQNKTKISKQQLENIQKKMLKSFRQNTQFDFYVKLLHACNIQIQFL